MQLTKLFRTNENQIPQSELVAQRERIISNMLRVMSALGLALVGAYAITTAIPQKHWVMLAIYIGVYAWTLVITFVRRMPYNVRVYGLLALIYFLGLATFLQEGLQSNGRLYWLAFMIIAGIVLGVRGGVIALLISLVTGTGIYYLMISGTVATPAMDNSEGYWIKAAVNFLAVGGATLMSMLTLVRSLESGLVHQRTLSIELEKERGLLEKNVADRTRDLARRLMQIRTAAEISQAISAVLDLNALLQKIVDLIKDRFEMNYVAAYLMDAQGSMAELSAATGEIGKVKLAEGHRLPVGGASMIGLAMANREPRAILDIFPGTDKPGGSYLPSSRTELALPLISGDKILGAITVQSNRPNAFDQDDITVLQGIVDSLAIALENARLFQQVQNTVEEVRALNRQYLVQTWTEVARTPGRLSLSVENPEALNLSAIDQDENTQSTPLEVPIVLRDQSIGKITLKANKPWSAEDTAFVEAVTTQAALALENARLLEETQRRAAQERFVAEIARKMRTTTDIETILRTAILELGRALRASEGRIQIKVGEDDSSPTKRG